MDINFVNWSGCYGELYERMTRRESVDVEKIGFVSGQTFGQISLFDYNYFDEKIQLSNAYVVKKKEPAGCPFLKDGDSGSLVCYDSNGKKRPFAYAVIQFDKLPTSEENEDGIVFQDPDHHGPYYVCFGLKTALKKLNLLNAVCFSDCGSNRNIPN